LLVEPTDELATAQIAGDHASALAMQARLHELFGSTLDYAVDEQTNVLTIAGEPHTVEAAERLVPELDRRTTQIHFEATILKPTRKGSKKKTIEGWLELGSWSRDMAVEAKDTGLIEIISAPSITTVVDRAGSMRSGTCTPMEGAEGGLPDIHCAPGSRFEGFELQLLPQMIGDELLVQITSVRRTWEEREAVSEKVVILPREAAVLVLSGEDTDSYVFVTARIIK
jgi:hypothetical protein